MRLCQELATQFDTLSLDPDLISKYNVAREQYEKRRFIYASANLEVMATPIHINQPENQNQYAIWRNIIEYERSNPQHLTSNELATRVHLALNKHSSLYIVNPIFGLHMHNMSLVQFLI